MLRRRRRRLVDLGGPSPVGEGAAQFRIGQDEIDRLVLGAEGRRAVLLGQLVVQPDNVGQCLPLQRGVLERQSHGCLGLMFVRRKTPVAGAGSRCQRLAAKPRAVIASPSAAPTGGTQPSSARVALSSTCNDDVREPTGEPITGSWRSTAKSALGTGKSRAGRPSAAARARINCGVEKSVPSAHSSLCPAAAGWIAALASRSTRF